MQPWLRKYNYIQDYFTTAYSLYEQLYPAYPVTYYSLDIVNSVMETDKLAAGTYEKDGVGDLSGAVWKKMDLLPVSSIEDVQPTQESGETGLTYFESMPTQITFPSTYGLKPLEWDVVDLNYGFKTKSIKLRPLFIVTQVNMAHMGDYYQLYQCRLQVAPYSRVELEQQISSYWRFDNHEKRLFLLENANFLLNMQTRSEELSVRLEGLFNNNLGFYLRSS